MRLALFHLMASVADAGEAAVGARGLSGPGYRGHVFWDADVFVLPVPRGDASRRPPGRCSSTGSAGCRPRKRRAPPGRPVGRPVSLGVGRDGRRRHADVGSRPGGTDGSDQDRRDGGAHRRRRGVGGRACYVDWTGDEAFLAGAGARLLVETARYWASRIETDPDGRAHIRGVIGPDEYHEAVDDNAFTNVMARWNLRRAGRP